MWSLDVNDNDIVVLICLKVDRITAIKPHCSKFIYRDVLRERQTITEPRNSRIVDINIKKGEIKKFLTTDEVCGKFKCCAVGNVAGRGYHLATSANNNRVTIFKLHGRHITGDQKVVQVKVRNYITTSLDHYVAIATTLGIDATGTIKVVHGRI